MARERKFSQEELYQAIKQLLLSHGYEAFTFTLLANKLDVSRAAIYKYYENKEELISEYMLYEINVFIMNLKNINGDRPFIDQFDALFDFIFNDMSLYKIRDIGKRIPITNKKVKLNKQKIVQHIDELYTSLLQFVELGKQKNILKKEIPNNLILGMIFETVNIPNLDGIPHQQWLDMIKNIIRHGMFESDNI